MKKDLVVTSLSKSYNDVKVVDELSLHINSGEIVGLLGPNGAGKTTAFHMIIGLIKPDHGTVSFQGCDITQFPIHQRSRLGLGYLSQTPSVFRDLTVEENMKTVLELIEENSREIEKRNDELLEEMGLSPYAKRKAGTLSGGERRRLEIARVLATRPKCLMLDEPFANVDPLAISDLKGLITLLKNKGISILITDHNARELVSIVDRGYLLIAGQNLKEGTASELLADAQARTHYFGEDFTA